MKERGRGMRKGWKNKRKRERIRVDGKETNL
jgi:hypothetical protein